MEPKKNPRLDLSRKTGLFLNIGMAISLLFVILAFEWKTYHDVGIVGCLNNEEVIDDIFQFPFTTEPPPPPPKVKVPEVIEVSNEKDIDDLETLIDVEVVEDDELDAIII